jgi:peptide/nickel transport system ATP-binding protein
MESILDIKNLTVHYTTEKGDVKAVEDVSFSIEEGGAVGIVGESGSGKTTLGLTILRILPKSATIVGGSILFNGHDLLQMNEEEIRKVRWKSISMVFQGAMNALNPVYRVGDQIGEALKKHNSNITNDETKKRVKELYDLVRLRYDQANLYPHEYSGGMKQRAIIAMALACRPKIVIADEPTTALDVIVQDSILREIRKLQEKVGMTLIYISHDIAVVAELCRKIAVMYAGRLVEYAETMDLFQRPLHPYTQGLMRAFPSLKEPKKELEVIPGEPPNLINPPTGCAFHPRCRYVVEICARDNPKLIEIDKGHYVACHLTRN